MNLKNNIKKLISNLSEDDIDKIDQTDLKYLSQSQISDYIHRAIELDRRYYLEMVCNLEETTSYLRYGTFSTFVEKAFGPNQKWQLMDGIGLIPLGLIEQAPLMVTKDKFIKEARLVNIPENFIKEIVSDKPKVMDDF